MNNFKQIFKGGSTTYFYSSLFFPKELKENVFRLYAFVRVADDYVDAIPQEEKNFRKFCKSYNRALQAPVGNEVIDSFVALCKEKNLSSEWTDAFLRAMASDLIKSTYDTLDETREYMYGSAEVIGLFMAQLMDLPKQSHASAQMLGRSMQYINFIRDISEDIELGRQYIPTSELKKYRLPSLSYESAMQNKDAFVNCIRAQIDTYFKWQKDAESGFHFIPRRYRIPIKTASDMYKWTAQQIYADPFVVFDRKVKPSKIRIMCQALKNTLGEKR